MAHQAKTPRYIVQRDPISSRFPFHPDRLRNGWFGAVGNRTRKWAACLGASGQRRSLAQAAAE